MTHNRAYKKNFSFAKAYPKNMRVNYCTTHEFSRLQLLP